MALGAVICISLDSFFIIYFVGTFKFQGSLLLDTGQFFTGYLNKNGERIVEQASK